MLYIHLLGHLRLFAGEQTLRFVAPPRTLPLLAYLLLYRDRPVPRESLAYLLWPDASEQDARTNLRRHLYHLRHALPQAPPQLPWLLSDSQSIRWNPATACWLDVSEFERLSISPEHLAKAVTLYGDDLLPELYEDWLSAHRERLRNLYFAALTQLIKQHRARHDYHQAIAYAQQALGRDPLREDVVRMLIALRYELGDRAGALHAYQLFEQRLQEELGVAPMEETVAAYQTVVADAPLPGADRARPLPASPRHNLPAQRNSFFGRDSDLLTIQQMLQEARLLTLTGPGGSGKTRLALETAARLLPNQAEAFPDGIFFVDLSAVTEPEGVLSAIAVTLDVRERGSQPLPEVLKAHLRNSYSLLLLDNFEQVIEAAPLVGDLLANAPGLRLLVTSRSPLHLYGEHEYAVPSLPLPDLERLPAADGLLEYAAIALFVARARAVNPHFTINDQNAPIVAEICVRLDGLPLAIELAAARSKNFSAAGILAELTNSLTFLAWQVRDLSARQQTLMETLQWSYNLLDVDEKRLFARLAIFAGGFTPEGAAVIAFGPDEPVQPAKVRDLLLSLADRNVIQQTAEAGPDQEPRFRMLATMREFALSLLRNEVTLASLRQRYVDYYVDLAARAEAAWEGQDQSRWLRQLRDEENNMRAALTWLLDERASPPSFETGARMARALKPFWQLSGRLQEGRDWLSKALQHARYLSPATQVRLLIDAGWMGLEQGDRRDLFFQEALAISRQTNNPELLSLSLHSLGAVAGQQGDYQSAEALLSEAVAVEQSASDGKMTAHLCTLYNNLAIVARRLGDYERARSLLMQALEWWQKEGNRLDTAYALTNLGNVALIQQDVTCALDFFRQSLTLRQALGDRVGIVRSLAGVAEVAMVQGKAIRSLRLYAASEMLRREINLSLTTSDQADLERNLAALGEQVGQPVFAAAWAEGAAMTLEEAVASALEQEVASSP